MGCVGERTVTARYTGFAPIGTCHWQALANVLLAHGLADARRRLGLSWGIRWDGSEILRGGGRWAALLEDLFGARVEDRQFASAEAADRHERALAERRLPFVAEIDAFHVPSPYEGEAHVVHTVIVAERSPDAVVILDTTNRPVPVAVPLGRYREMRAAPCEGRAEPHRLYAPQAGPYRDVSAPVVLAAVRSDVARHAGSSLAALDAFTDRYESAGGREGPVNVCRVAAERHQAALVFDRLAADGIAGAAGVAAELRALAEQWYAVHMLTAHPQAGGDRHRARILRFLRRLAGMERSLLRAQAAP
jgi:hypothetical protein